MGSKKRQSGKEYEELLEKVRPIAQQLAALQAKARSLGIFLNDRALLECPECGLQEDVAFGGQLITCRPPAFGQDTGMRFRELPKNRFRCPSCGSGVQEVLES
jgi:hypothetical protein